MNTIMKVLLLALCITLAVSTRSTEKQGTIGFLEASDDSAVTLEDTTTLTANANANVKAVTLVDDANIMKEEQVKRIAAGLEHSIEEAKDAARDSGALLNGQLEKYSAFFETNIATLSDTTKASAESAKADVAEILGSFTAELKKSINSINNAKVVSLAAAGIKAKNEVDAAAYAKIEAKFNSEIGKVQARIEANIETSYQDAAADISRTIKETISSSASIAEKAQLEFNEAANDVIKSVNELESRAAEDINTVISDFTADLTRSAKLETAAEASDVAAATDVVVSVGDELDVQFLNARLSIIDIANDALKQLEAFNDNLELEIYRDLEQAADSIEANFYSASREVESIKTKLEGQFVFFLGQAASASVKAYGAASAQLGIQAQTSLLGQLNANGEVMGIDKPE